MSLLKEPVPNQRSRSGYCPLCEESVNLTSLRNNPVKASFIHLTRHHKRDELYNYAAENGLLYDAFGGSSVYVIARDIARSIDENLFHELGKIRKVKKSCKKIRKVKKSCKKIRKVKKVGVIRPAWFCRDCKSHFDTLASLRLHRLETGCKISGVKSWV